MDPARGDSVAVVLLPRGHSSVADTAAIPHAPVAAVRDGAPMAANQRFQASYATAWVVGPMVIVMMSLLSAVLWSRGRARRAAGREEVDDGVDIDAATVKVRQWIAEGVKHDQG
jgi:hypothetical protein